MKARTEGDTLQTIALALCVSDDFMKRVENGDKEAQRRWVKVIKKQGESKANLEKIAKDALNFDDKFNMTLSIFKTSLIPLVDELNNGLGPKIDGLVKKIVEGKWLDKLSNFAGSIGKIISKLSGIFLDHPIISAIAGAGALFVKSIYSAAIWFKNGLMLAKGFNSGAGGGGMMNGIGGGFGKMVS